MSERLSILRLITKIQFIVGLISFVISPSIAAQNAEYNRCLEELKSYCKTTLEANGVDPVCYMSNLPRCEEMNRTHHPNQPAGGGTSVRNSSPADGAERCPGGRVNLLNNTCEATNSGGLNLGRECIEEDVNGNCLRYAGSETLPGPSEPPGGDGTEPTANVDPEPPNSNKSPTATTATTAGPTCAAAYKEANTCCGKNPETCVLGEFGAGVAPAVIALIQGVSTMQGMKEACGAMSTAGYFGGGLNAATAAKCNSTRNECSSICSAELAANPNSVKLKEYIKTCDEDFKNKAIAMSAQVLPMAAAVKAAEMCKDMVAAQDNFTNDKLPETNVDCSNPVYASSPSCDRCKGPNAQYDPLCRTAQKPLATGLTGSGSASPMGTAGATDVGADPYDSSDQANYGGGAVEAASAKAIGGGSGGGAFGGGSAAAGSGDGGGGGGAGAGHDTDVLRGERGGGGYASAMGYNSGGGFSGYGTGANGDRKDPKFDLKAFLPGGKKDPRRNVAGMGGAALAPDIGPASGNIFFRISTRVKNLCSKNRMMDCR